MVHSSRRRCPGASDVMSDSCPGRRAARTVVTFPVRPFQWLMQCSTVVYTSCLEDAHSRCRSCTGNQSCSHFPAGHAAQCAQHCTLFLGWAYKSAISCSKIECSASRSEALARAGPESARCQSALSARSDRSHSRYSPGNTESTLVGAKI